MEPVGKILPLLHIPRKVVITMHQKPDPDAMGSSLGLYNFLRKFGHDVTVISPTNWPQFLNWMPGCEHVLDYENEKSKADKHLEEADWLFCLDFNTLSRTKTMEPMIRATKAERILIDHHEDPQVSDFDYGISIIPKSATSEMVYDFIIDSGHADKIDDRIAECLYAGVMSDTGSFRFPVTTAGVHLMVADLMRKGINHARIHEAIYDSYNENRLRFIGHVLSNRLQIFYEYNAALIAITKADIQRFQIKAGDTEGLANYPLSIKGIRLAALLTDRDEERRWSFRSKGDFDCCTFARKHFDGGGHHNAAGGRSRLSLEDNVRQFREALPEYAKQLQ